MILVVLLDEIQKDVATLKNANLLAIAECVAYEGDVRIIIVPLLFVNVLNLVGKASDKSV